MLSATPSIAAKCWLARAVVWVVLAVVGLQAQPGGFVGTPPKDAARKYLIRRFQSDDGFPQDSATAITQTPDGYLWFGSWRGLLRYNGQEFQPFNPPSGPNALSRAILGLYPDTRGTLWTAHMGGRIARLQGDRFEEVQLPSRNQVSNAITAFGETPDGEFYIGTGQGLCRLRSGKPEFVDDMPGLPPDGIVSLSQDASGDLWCFMSNPSRVGAIRNRRYVSSPDGARLEGLRISGISLRPDGRMSIICARDNRLVRSFLSPDGSITTPEPFAWKDGGVPWAITADRSGSLWLGTNGEGLRRVYPDGTYDILGVEQGLSSDLVRSIFEDREGSIWVGTDGGGVNQIRPRGVQHFGREEGLPVDIVYSLAADPVGGGVLVATHGGGVYRLTHGRFELPRPGPSAWPGYCWSIFVDSRHRTWAGSLMGDGVYVAEGAEPQRLGLMTGIRAFAEDHSGAIWVGGPKIQRWSNGAFQILSNGAPATASATSFAASPDGGMWVGSEGEGLYRFQNDRFTRFGREDGLPHDQINALYLDTAGALWVGTDAGMARGVDGRFRRIGKEQGLTPTSIRGIAEDRRGYLWLATSEGVARLLKADAEAVAGGAKDFLSAAVFDKQDGMMTRECTTYTHPKIAQTPDGKLWFSTLKGVVMVDPNALTLNTHPPPVVVERVLADGKPMLGGSGLAPHLTLSAGVERVEIQYAALSYSAPEKVRFRHRLSGLQETWVDAGNSRSVAYDRLRPGDYRFELMAANSDGVWTPVAARIALHVEPFFWETRSFISSILLGAAALPVLLMRWISLRRFRRELARLEQVAAVERERNRIARDMHDDLGARLTKIAFYGELAERAVSDPAASVNHVRAVSRMSREAARSLNEMVWAVKPSNDTLPNLVGYLCQYATEYLEPTPIRLRFDLPPTPPVWMVHAETRHHVFLVVKEALNNVVKHSGATEVWIRLHLEERLLVAVVSDNGHGLDASTSGAGNGLANMRQRAREVGGDVQFLKNESGGLDVRLQVPLPEVEGLDGFEQTARPQRSATPPPG